MFYSFIAFLLGVLLAPVVLRLLGPVLDWLYESWYEARMRGQILPNWVVVLLVIALFGGIGVLLAWRG